MVLPPSPEVSSLRRKKPLVGDLLLLLSKDLYHHWKPLNQPLSGLSQTCVSPPPSDLRFHNHVHPLPSHPHTPALIHTLIGHHSLSGSFRTKHRQIPRRPRHFVGPQ